MHNDPERELALLQIAQLQEELEYYYVEYSKLKDKNIGVNTGYYISAPLLRQARLRDSDYSASSHKSYTDKLIEDNADLTSRISGLNELHSQLEARNQELLTKISKLESALSSFKLKKRQQLDISDECLANYTVEKAPMGDGNKFLVSRISKLEQFNTQLEARNFELLENASAEKEVLVSEKIQLASRISELEELNTQLDVCNSQLLADEETLVLEKAVLTSSISDLRELNSHQEANNFELEQKNLQLEMSNAALICKETAQKKAFVTERAVQATFKSNISILESDINQLTIENSELIRSNRLNEKMLAKSQIDLDHLRKNYSEKIKSESGLVELIKELREKLTIASQYYYQLQQDHPELIKNTSSERD